MKNIKNTSRIVIGMLLLSYERDIC